MLFAFQQKASAISHLKMAEKGEIRPKTVPPAAGMVWTGNSSKVAEFRGGWRMIPSSIPQSHMWPFTSAGQTCSCPNWTNEKNSSQNGEQKDNWVRKKKKKPKTLPNCCMHANYMQKRPELPNQALSWHQKSDSQHPYEVSWSFGSSHLWKHHLGQKNPRRPSRMPQGAPTPPPIFYNLVVASPAARWLKITWIRGQMSSKYFDLWS